MANGTQTEAAPATFTRPQINAWNAFNKRVTALETRAEAHRKALEADLLKLAEARHELAAIMGLPAPDQGPGG
jgi:hypothetical protein